MPRHRGSDNWTVQLKQGGQVIGITSITDLNNGQYSVAYLAPTSGTWEVWAQTSNDASQTKIGAFNVQA